MKYVTNWLEQPKMGANGDVLYAWAMSGRFLSSKWVLANIRGWVFSDECS